MTDERSTVGEANAGGSAANRPNAGRESGLAADNPSPYRVDERAIPPGLAVLSGPPRRSGGIRRLALRLLGGTGRGTAYWIDARNAASTFALYNRTTDTDRLGHGRKRADSNRLDRRTTERLRIARAFTAYQHHSLVRTAIEQADPKTALLVAPNVASLYADDDLPEYERKRLLQSSVTALHELGVALGIPVLASVDDGLLATVVTDAANTAVECRKTSEGYYYAVGDYETTVYWSDGYWQTTIPYWVKLFGSVAKNDASGIVGAGSVGFEDTCAGIETDGNENSPATPPFVRVGL